MDQNRTMSGDKLVDIDLMSDASVSEYLDAQADTYTPTIGEEENLDSDSEGTLSDLSFDNEGVITDHTTTEDNYVSVQSHFDDTISKNLPKNPQPSPVPQPRSSQQAKNNSKLAAEIQFKLTNVDGMMEEEVLKLELPPGETYKGPTADFPRSPSQLKFLQGPSFMPKEEISAISEDESSVSSYRAHLDLNNGQGKSNGAVRMHKKDSLDESDNYPNSNNTNSSTSSSAMKKPIVQFDLDPKVNGKMSNGNGYHQNQNHDKRNGHQNGHQLNSILLNGQDGPESGPVSLMYDDMDDYMEDYIDPTGESVMQRATSFRRKVQNQNFQNQLENSGNSGKTSPESDHSSGGSSDHNHRNFGTPTPLVECDNCSRQGDTLCPSCIAKTVPKLLEIKSDHEDHSKVSNGYYNNNGISNGGDMISMGMSMIELDDGDLDDIIESNAPNLMKNGGSSKRVSFSNDPEDQSLQVTDDFYLQKDTLDRLQAVYESNNFTNLYTLSGELKHILSPVEIEEIVANKEHLEKYIDPKLMAALIQSTNSPPKNGGKQNLENVPNSNSTNSSSSKNNFERSTPLTNSLRRRIALEKNGDLELDFPRNYDQLPPQNPTSFSRSSSLRSSTGSRNSSQSAPHSTANSRKSSMSLLNGFGQSFDDLRVENDIESAGTGSDSGTKTPELSNSNNNIFLVRRDSKRFNKGAKMSKPVKENGVDIDSVDPDHDEDDGKVEGLFIESNTPLGDTYKKIKAPLNISSDDFENDPLNQSTELESEDKTARKHKKRITVDEKILSIASELDDSHEDRTESDVFHSILDSLRLDKNDKDDDPTIKSENDDLDEDDMTLDISTPDELEESIMEQLDSLASLPSESPSKLIPSERIPELSLDEELEDERRWKSFRVGDSELQIDLKAIQPYRRVLSHGGYVDAERKIAIILFSGCYLPDRSRKEYAFLMEHLFLYVLSTMEELIVDEYVIVFLHGATPKNCMPNFSFLKKCYQLIDRRLRKNLKTLYLVHPTFWLKTVVALSKPFISSKFSRKLKFINNLPELCLEIPTEHLVIPERVLAYDVELKIAEYKKTNNDYD